MFLFARNQEEAFDYSLAYVKDNRIAERWLNKNATRAPAVKTAALGYKTII